MKIYVPDYMLVPMRDVVATIGAAAKKELDVISNRRRLSAEEKWDLCQPLLARITMFQQLWSSLVDAVDMVGDTPQATVDTVDTQGNGEDAGDQEDGKQTSYVTQAKDPKPTSRTRPDPEADAPGATAGD